MMIDTIAQITTYAYLNSLTKQPPPITENKIIGIR